MADTIWKYQSQFFPFGQVGFHSRSAIARVLIAG
jgi:hypothetical protein